MSCVTFVQRGVVLRLTTFQDHTQITQTLVSTTCLEEKLQFVTKKDTPELLTIFNPEQL